MVAKYPGDAYAWYGQAQSLAGLHRYVEALVSTEQALAATTAKPTSVSWRLQMWLFKGGTLYSLHRNTEALSALDESLALNPNYSLAWAQKAYILQRDGYQEQALAAAERALNGNGILSGSIWRGMALIAKAGALNGIGRYMDGLDTAKQALPFAPQSSSIWIVQADALAHLGHPDEAQQAANQGLAKVEQQIADYSERWEYWENKAALLRLLGRMGEAETAEAQTQALIEKLTPPTT
jgi:tetratricopeptide (TPR) repeat protein